MQSLLRHRFLLDSCFTIVSWASLTCVACMFPRAGQAGDFTLTSSSNLIECHLYAFVDTDCGVDEECRELVYAGADENNLLMTETDCLTSTTYTPVSANFEFWDPQDRENAEAFTIDEYARAELWDGMLIVSDRRTSFGVGHSDETDVFCSPATGTASTSIDYSFTRESTFSTTSTSETLDPVLQFIWGYYDDDFVTDGGVNVNVTLWIGTTYEITMKVENDDHVWIRAYKNGVLDWSKQSSTEINDEVGSIKIDASEYPVDIYDGDTVEVDCRDVSGWQTARSQTVFEMGMEEIWNGSAPDSGFQFSAGIGG